MEPDRVLRPLTAIQESAWRLRLREDDLLFAELQECLPWASQRELIAWWKLRKRLKDVDRSLFE